MRSLFSKIFLWFWLAQGLMGAVLILVTVATWPRPREIGWQDVTRDTLNLHARMAAAILQQDGKRGVQTFLEVNARNGAGRMGIYDPQGREIVGRQLPKNVRETALRYGAATPYREITPEAPLYPEVSSHGDAVLGAVWLPVPGKKLILAGEMPRIELRSWGTPLTAGTLREEVWPMSGLRAIAFWNRQANIVTAAPAVGVPGQAASTVEMPVPDEPLPPEAGKTAVRFTATSTFSKGVGGSVGMASFAGPPLRPLAFAVGSMDGGGTGWELPLRLLAVFLTGGLVCYAMARYLATPAVSLQRATRRLADGDLSARVGTAMGRRRDELADLGRDFDRMAGRLENLVLSERRLLADISHELRSPLTRLQVALELARQDAGAKAQPSLTRIEDEADRLNALIGQLLTLTRLENGLPGGASAPVDLEGTLRKIAEDADFEASAAGKSVTLSTDAPAWTHGDADLLHRAVENVVRNAVRYTAPNTAVELELSKAAQPEGPYARVRVRDHGPGVPEPQLNEIFRPFYRVNTARDAASGGVGLGLSITERAVRLHDGQVHASNAEDGGLIVEIQLPLLRERVAAT